MKALVKEACQNLLTNRMMNQVWLLMPNKGKKRKLQPTGRFWISIILIPQPLTNIVFFIYINKLKPNYPKQLYSRSQHWNTNFREFRAYSDCVLDYLRKKGINAKLILRVGTGDLFLLSHKNDWTSCQNLNFQLKDGNTNKRYSA